MTRRQAQQQDPNANNPLALLASLGLNANPMDQLGGLVNLVNQLGEAGRWEQEFGLRQQAGELDQQRVQQQEEQFRMQQDQVDQQEAQEQKNWAAAYGLQKLTAKQARELQLEEFDANRKLRDQQLMINLLDLARSTNRITGEVEGLNPMGLAAMAPAGYDFASMLNAQPNAVDPTAGFTAEQKLQAAARAKLGF